MASELSAKEMLGASSTRNLTRPLVSPSVLTIGGSFLKKDLVVENTGKGHD